LFSDDADLVLSTTAALATRLVAASGPVPEAVALHRQAVRLARAERPVDESRLITVLSRACAALVEVEPADGRPLCQEAIKMSARLPMQGALHAAYSALAQEAANRGDWSAAVVYRRQALEVVEATAPHSNLVPLVSSLLALAEWMSGLDKPGGLQRAGASARMVSETMPNSAWSYAPYLVQALILNQTGDGLAAEQWIRRAIAVTGYDLDRDPRAALPHMVLAHALLLQGKREEARGLADRGLVLAERSHVADPIRQGLAAIRRAADAASRDRVGGGPRARAQSGARPTG
jgi:tetratricopeptide (TPR) repeat protein